MGRKSLKIDRKKEIVKAFYEVAIKEGLENTSFSKIAKHIKMPPSLLVHYFQNKNELLQELTEFIINNYKLIYTADQSNCSNSLNRLKSIIDNMFSRKWNTYFDDGVYYSYYALIFRDPHIKKKYYDLHHRLRQWLTEAIQECKDDGFINVGSAKNVSELIFALSDGAYYYLGMVDDMNLYKKKMKFYKQQAINLLRIKSEN